ncbi:MAG TPA: metallophosphoesterase [Myxococcota bacterium]
MRALVAVMLAFAACTPSASPPSPPSPATSTSTQATTALPGIPKEFAVRPDELVLVGAGDIASCSTTADEATGQLVQRLLDASSNAWAFTLGDNAYPDGSMAQFRQCYEPAWGAFKSRTIPVVGNHDWRTPNAGGYRSTFAGRFTQDGPLWFSQDVEGVDVDGTPVKWRVVVLDSDCDMLDCGKDGAQYKWLTAELAKQKLLGQQCSIVMFHHPRFSSGPHGDAVFMSKMWKDLADAGVDLVLAGHDHIYERFPAMDENGVLDDKNGMPSLVVGTGGKSHYPAPFARAHSITRSSDTDGVLVLRLTKTGWTSGLWTTGGGVMDVHSGTCR